MRRYWYDLDLETGQEVEISDEVFKHIFKVCRRKEGDKFELLSSNKVYLVEVKKLLSLKAIVVILEEKLISKLKEPYFHLILGNPRPTVFEKVIEKSVELGVSSITPLITEKSFFKSKNNFRMKEERVQRIITQAMQQTGRSCPLEIKKPLELDEFLRVYQTYSSVKGYFLYEGGSSIKMPNSENSKLKEVYILIGGEGGFSKAEAESINSGGFEEVFLGEQILRVETACVAGLSILKSRLGMW